MRVERRLRYTWIILGLPLLLRLLAINCKVEADMPKTTSEIPLSAVPVDGASAISKVQLVPGEKSIELLYSMTRPLTANGRGYETSISSIGIGNGGHPSSRLFSIPQLLAPPPSWDAAPASLGLYSVVYEKALGATFTLLLRDAKQAETAVTADYPFESFTKPHFIKGSQDDSTRMLTAISDEKSAVLFTRGPDGRYQRRAKLCDCSDAVILRYRNEFLLFYKVVTPGPVRGNLIQPGTLRYARLASDFVPTGTPVEALPGSVVFEFDVAAHEGNLAILATTKSGTILARGASLKEPLRLDAFEEKQKGELASSPSVLVTDSRVDVAIMESAQKRQARLLIGSAPAIEQGH